jgi:hypothetical protein
MKRILAIDGGGIKGLIPALALVALERATGKRTQELFDMFSGTSTGGIVALGLARGMTPHQICDLFEKRGGEIFSKPWYWWGLTGPKYSATGIEKVLFEELGEAPLSSSLKPVSVFASSLEDRRAVIFRSWGPEASEITFWGAARATSAAQTFFPAFGRQRYADGGVWANCPAHEALILASDFYPGEPLQLLSLGCGKPERPIEMRGEGLIGHASYIIGELMDFVADAAVRKCERRLGDQFVRVQVPFFGDDKWPMDEASPKYMRRLRLAAEHSQAQIETLVRTGWIKP